jgi:hypothetical protein
MEELLPAIMKLFTGIDNRYGSRAARAIQPEIVADPFCYPFTETNDFHPFVKQITQIVVEASRQTFMAMGCAADSFNRFEQFIRNETNIVNAYKISALFDKFHDTPAVVVGGGPSMEDFIKYYHEYDLYRKSLIIACDASLPRLLKEKCPPHIVTRCERKKTHVLNGVTIADTKDIFFAAYPWVDPYFFSLFENHLMCFRDNGLCKWSEFSPGMVNGGVSAANAAYELALLFRCPKIVFTGVDLCMIDNKTHVSGTHVEFDIEKSKAKHADIMCNDGQMRKSIPVWNRCLHEYTGATYKHIPKYKFQTINTSAAGGKIDLISHQPWPSIKSIFNDRKYSLRRIQDHLLKHDDKAIDGFKTMKVKTVGILNEMLWELEKLFLLLDDCMLTCMREEQKAVNIVRVIHEAKDFFRQVESIKKSLMTVFKEPARQVDNFRQRFFAQQNLYTLAIIDILQLDYYTTENKYASLPNVLDLEHERFREYVNLQAVFLKNVEFYSKKVIDLLLHGAVDKYDYKITLSDHMLDMSLGTENDHS